MGERADAPAGRSSGPWRAGRPGWGHPGWLAARTSIARARPVRQKQHDDLVEVREVMAAAGALATMGLWYRIRVRNIAVARPCLYHCPKRSNLMRDTAVMGIFGEASQGRTHCKGQHENEGASSDEPPHGQPSKHRMAMRRTHPFPGSGSLQTSHALSLDKPQPSSTVPWAEMIQPHRHQAASRPSAGQVCSHGECPLRRADRSGRTTVPMGREKHRELQRRGALSSPWPERSR